MHNINALGGFRGPFYGREKGRTLTSLRAKISWIHDIRIGLSI